MTPHDSQSRATSATMPRVRVEFFGMPRQRAGLAALDVEVQSLTLGDVLVAAGKQLPEFSRTCLDGSRLKPGMLANINGRRFTTDVQAALLDQECVLILAADVGGD